MVPFRHVVLVGLSGSGKTTVGRQLAAVLGRPFVDTDELITAAAGRPIPQIFAEQGEPAFRALEREAVQRALSGPPAVIATGGGAPVDEANRCGHWRGNAVVWLDAPVDVLAARLGAAGAGRPLLADPRGPAARLAALHAARAPVYAGAHLRVDAAVPPAQVVATIVDALRAFVKSG